MNKTKWLEKLESQGLTYVNNTVKLSLDNIKQAAKILNLSKPAPYVVTIAGTNGKGTTTKLLEYLLYNSGFKVGATISPYLISFNERISINTENISDQNLVSSFEYVYKILEQNQITVTYFEFLTLITWYIFSVLYKNKLDIVLLEIGLGGRLDANNIINKDLAIITNVDYDHQHILGDTLDKIGYEKAGIIENNIKVILGSEEMPNSVLDIAYNKTDKNNIFQYNKHYSYSSLLDKYNLNINLPGLQYNNISTSFKAFELILEKFEKNLYKIISDNISNHINNFKLLGRCSWLDSKKKILIDVAHNVQSISYLKEYLTNYKSQYKDYKITAICGMLNDKDIANNLKIISPIIDEWHFVNINSTRGAKSEDLAAVIKNYTNNYKCYYNLKNCFDSCYSNIICDNNISNKIGLTLNQQSYRGLTAVTSLDPVVKPRDDGILCKSCKNILLVFGSFYIVGPFCKLYFDTDNTDKV